MTKLTITGYQHIVDDWIKSHGVRYFNELTNTVMLMEEVGELSRYVARKYGEQSFKKRLTDLEIGQHIEDEMADIFFVLTCLANQMDINLEDILSRNMDKKTTRDRDRHKQNEKLKD